MPYHNPFNQSPTRTLPLTVATQNYMKQESEWYGPIPILPLPDPTFDSYHRACHIRMVRVLSVSRIMYPLRYSVMYNLDKPSWRWRI